MDPEQKSVAEEFDQYNKNYKQAVNNSLANLPFKVDFFTRIKIDYFMDILSQEGFSPNETKVLDMGCGIGMYHGSLKDQVGSLTGIDVSEKCIEQAQQMNPDVKYVSYSGGKLPFASNTFDAAITICVMHHVPVKGREIFISEMNRVLKPGGLAVIFEHNPKNFLTMRVVNNCPFDEDAVLLDRMETESLLSASPFKHAKSRFILSIPPANKPFRLVDKLFSRLPFGAQFYTYAVKK